MFQHRHYEFLAEFLNTKYVQAAGSPEEEFAIRHLITELAGRLALDNPRFKFDRFFKACGI